jgi:hypothetical protein
VSPSASSPGLRSSSVVVLSKEEKKNPKFNSNTVSVTSEGKKKKQSGDSFMDAYLRLWLTCHLLSAICYCRLYLL